MTAISVRHGGNEFLLEGHPWSGVFKLRADEGLREIDLYWNGVPFGEDYLPRGWRGYPFPRRWIPVAWACCLVDRGRGGEFAQAILEADVGDDVPASIACDWMEESGHLVRLPLSLAANRRDAILRAPALLCDRDRARCEAMPAGEFIGRSVWRSSRQKTWSVRYPIGWWARSMMEWACVRCGWVKASADFRHSREDKFCAGCGKVRPPRPQEICLPDVLEYQP